MLAGRIFEDDHVPCDRADQGTEILAARDSAFPGNPVCSVQHRPPFQLFGPVEHPLDHAQAQSVGAVPLQAQGLDDRLQRRGGQAPGRALALGEGDQVREADNECLSKLALGFEPNPVL